MKNAVGGGSVREMYKELSRVRKDIDDIKNNDLLHMREKIDELEAQVQKLIPRTSSFYFGVLFIIFIVGMAFLSLPLNIGIGVAFISVAPLLICIYAISQLQKRRA